MHDAGERVAEKMRQNLFHSILRQDVAFFDAHKSGEIISRLTSDVQVRVHSLLERSCYMLQVFCRKMGPHITWLFFLGAIRKGNTVYSINIAIIWQLPFESAYGILVIELSNFVLSHLFESFDGQLRRVRRAERAASTECIRNVT